MQANPQKIVVLGTGGTIAGESESADEGLSYKAAQRGISELLKSASGTHLPWPEVLAACQFEAEQVAQLDSKDMGFDVWVKLAQRVAHFLSQADVQAIVNSANANLRLGSGVAGAIHTAAGPELEAFCQPFAPLELGAALITPGFKLPNPWVIHVRAAHYIHHTEPERYMAFAMFSVLNTARDNGITSLAMPAIGTGVFAFPPLLAAEITGKVLRRAEHLAPHLQCLRLCVASEFLRDLYTGALEAAGHAVSQPNPLAESHRESAAV